jgi:hypothetical protein
VGLLRRLFGGARDGEAADRESAQGQPEPLIDVDEEERAHELELARFEQERTTELMRRQQRYGGRSWTPPAQGGSRRADDETEGDAGG